MIMGKYSNLSKEEWNQIKELKNRRGMNMLIEKKWQGTKISYGDNAIIFLSSGPDDDPVQLVKFNGKIQKATIELLLEIM